MNSRLLAISLIAGLIRDCSTSVPPSGTLPKPGMALVKGGSVMNGNATAQYSYVVGVDGVILPSWTGSYDITPGTHDFVFGASHANGFKSFAEVSMTVKEGDTCLIEASNWTEATATYIIYALPGRKEIFRASAPMIATSESDATERISSMLVAKGWRKQTASQTQLLPPTAPTPPASPAPSAPPPPGY